MTPVVWAAASVADELAAGAAVINGLGALLALVECPLINPKVNEAAKASETVDIVASVFFTFDLFISIFFSLSQIQRGNWSIRPSEDKNPHRG
ncbi:MAG TPA: hypothetical protein VFY40_04205 [Blastocatellia bacterium]|nr:hypothetical protein [Blastocatellia bacterium]